MARDTKPTVSMETTFDRLDIRVGRIIDVAPEPSTRKPTYRMEIDFGKFGKRIAYGRFTRHAIGDVKDRLVLGILNFGPRKMGEVVSEVLVLGVQFPKAESGEATFVSPATDARIGSKLF